MIDINDLTENPTKCALPLTHQEAYTLLHQMRLYMLAMVSAVNAYKHSTPTEGDKYLREAMEAFQKLDRRMIDLVFDVRPGADGG